MPRWWLIVLIAFASSVAAAPPSDRPWIDQVQREGDRGAGRIEDRPTWQMRRYQEDRDERFGLLRPRREFELLDEERDRQLRIEAKARRAPRLGEAASGPDRGSILLQQPVPRAGSVGPSPLAVVVAREQRELAEAKATLDRSLRAVDAAEGRDLRALKRRLNREGRADLYDAERQPIERQYESQRAAHRRAFEQVRARIVGQKSP